MDTLGVKLPRCEDHSRTRKDRAYAFSSSLSAVEGSDCFEPGDGDRGLLRSDGSEPLSLQPGDGVLIPVKREGGGLQGGSLCEAVLPVEGQVEAIPGVWDTGAVEGSIHVAALDADLTLQPGDVVAEVRAGCVDSSHAG